MKVSQLTLQIHVETGCAGNVACTARASAERIDSFVHCVDHVIILAHAKIVVRAPDDDVFFFAVLETRSRTRERPTVTLQVNKYAIPPFFANGADRLLESLEMLHYIFLAGGRLVVSAQYLANTLPK